MKTTFASLTFLCISLFFTSLMLTNISNAQLKMDAAVAIWLFDEGEGEIVTDASGNGNDGVFASGQPKWVDGKFGTALDFNEDWVEGREKEEPDDWVETNDPVVVDTADFTIGCWLKPRTPQHWHANVLSSQEETRGITLAQYENSTNRFRIIIGNIYNWNKLGHPDHVFKLLKQWSHVAFVREGSQGTWYQNGEVILQEKLGSADRVPAATKNFRIGNCVHDDNRVYNGTIDEAFIFEVAMRGREIVSIAEKGIVGAQSVSPLDKMATIWGSVKNEY